MAKTELNFWLGVVVGGAAVALIGFGGFYLGRLSRAPGAASGAANFAQQRICADAAGAVARTAGNATVSSHYNPTYGRCFVAVYSHDAIHTFRSISDAVEHSDYALYVESIADGNTTLVDCRVRLPNVPFVPCKSFDEWQTLVKPLMGDQ